MQLNHKLALLELTVGLFGWVWMLAGLAGVVCLAMVFVAGWPWWSALLAFGAAAVGKWVFRVVYDTQLGATFEDEMVAQGYTRAEARKILVDVCAGRLRASDIPPPSSGATDR